MSRGKSVAYVILQYDRPSDVRNWNEYNSRVREWIPRFLDAPGAVSFVGYRTADGSSPDTMAMLAFRTVDDARRARSSEQIKTITDELRGMGVVPKILVVERSPFTPEPVLASGDVPLP
jgi:hypothetical protein